MHSKKFFAIDHDGVYGISTIIPKEEVRKIYNEDTTGTKNNFRIIIAYKSQDDETTHFFKDKSVRDKVFDRLLIYLKADIISKNEKELNILI